MEVRTRGHRYAGATFGREEGQHYYSAAVALVGLGLQTYGMVSAPSGKPTTAQKIEMQKAQARADEQYALQKILQPFVLEQMGLEAEYGPGGAVTSLKKRAATPAEQRAEKVKALAEEKVIAGLEGRLDIDPAATRALNEDEARQAEYLARALGPDFRMASGGATALAKGREGRRVTESAIRRGEMTASEAIAQGRISNEDRQMAMRLGLMRGLPQDLARGALVASAIDPYTSELAQREYERKASMAGGWAGMGGGILKAGALLYGMKQGQKDGGTPAQTGGGGGWTPPAEYYSQSSWT